MFVVIFEVQPKKERWDDYLALAKQAAMAVRLSVHAPAGLRS